MFLFCDGNLLQAAFLYGLVVHLRIYPIIYALPIVLVLDPFHFRSNKKLALMEWSSSNGRSAQNLSSKKFAGAYNLWVALTSMFTKERLMFGLVSGAVFFICTGIFFFLYGWEFLHEALLYHLTRTDPRHNFSIYFYLIYLHYEHEFSVTEKLISFLPQFVVQLALVFRFAQDFPFCFFVQMVAFVAFSKNGREMKPVASTEAQNATIALVNVNDSNTASNNDQSNSNLVISGNTGNTDAAVTGEFSNSSTITATTPEIALSEKVVTSNSSVEVEGDSGLSTMEENADTKQNGNQKPAMEQIKAGNHWNLGMRMWFSVIQLILPILLPP